LPESQRVYEDRRWFYYTDHQSKKHYSQWIGYSVF
jgi:hypothetical protein